MVLRAFMMRTMAASIAMLCGVDRTANKQKKTPGRYRRTVRGGGEKGHEGWGEERNTNAFGVCSDHTRQLSRLYSNFGHLLAIVLFSSSAGKATSLFRNDAGESTSGVSDNNKLEDRTTQNPTHHASMRVNLTDIERPFFSWFALRLLPPNKKTEPYPDDKIKGAAVVLHRKRARHSPSVLLHSLWIVALL